MCRCHDDGGRRCPSQLDPARKAIAVASQLVARWDKRHQAALAAGDQKAADKALDRFVAAIDSLGEREGRIANALRAAIPPTRADEYTAARLREMSTDQLGDELAGLNDDPVAADRVVAEMLRRDDEDQQLHANLSVEAIADMDDFDRYTAWVRTENHPELRARIEEQWRREGVNPAAMTGADPFGAQADITAADDAPELSATDQQRLAEGWQTLSWRKYAALEESLITNPAHRTSLDEIKARGTVSNLEVELRQEYSEFLDDLHVQAENACRGKLLNRKGEARGVDPNDILRGNVILLRNYASEELRSFLAGQGGAMSYSRWMSEHKQSANSPSNQLRFQDRDVVA